MLTMPLIGARVWTQNLYHTIGMYLPLILRLLMLLVGFFFFFLSWKNWTLHKTCNELLQVNEGKYDDAISIFNKVVPSSVLFMTIFAISRYLDSAWCLCGQILRENPTYPEALIGRGTAYAFQRELENAIADFSKVYHATNSSFFWV